MEFLLCISLTICSLLGFLVGTPTATTHPETNHKHSYYSHMNTQRFDMYKSLPSRRTCVTIFHSFISHSPASGRRCRRRRRSGPFAQELVHTSGSARWMRAALSHAHMLPIVITPTRRATTTKNLLGNRRPRAYALRLNICRFGVLSASYSYVSVCMSEFSSCPELFCYTHLQRKPNTGSCQYFFDSGRPVCVLVSARTKLEMIEWCFWSAVVTIVCVLAWRVEVLFWLWSIPSVESAHCAVGWTLVSRWFECAVHVVLPDSSRIEMRL